MLRRSVLMLPLAGALVLAPHWGKVVFAQAPGPGQDASPQGSPKGDQGGRAGRHGQYAGMGHVAGEITAVSGTMLTVKTEDGSSVGVVTTDNTRVMKERGPVRVSDLHVGDGLMAMGNLDPATHTLHAAVVMAEDAAQVKAMRENLGKTYITGRVTAVNLDEARMTVERPDHVAQTIGFDETTSFKRAVRPQRTGGSDPGSGGGDRPDAGGGAGGGFRGMMGAGGGLDQAFNNGESITLADIKVGDRVGGTGSVKGGTFVPVHLLDSPPGPRRPHSGADAGTPAASGSMPPGA